MSLPIVAIVGRPNVGKSTLYNRLTHRRAAIVDSTPGVTRDRLYGEVQWGKAKFELIDTGGLIPGNQEKLTLEIKKQVSLSIKEADLVLFLVDGEEGLHHWDEEIGKLLRKTGKPIILVVNKIDGVKRALALPDFYKFGFPNIVPISAIHGLNIPDLMDLTIKSIPSGQKEKAPKPMKIMILGHPNVGKSTLINKLLGTERVIVDEVPGTTRDIVEIPFSFRGDNFLLLDTSGIRREGKIRQRLEKVAVKKTKTAIKEADLVLFLIDMRIGVVREDLSIGSILEENAKALIVLLNKCDLIGPKERKEYFQAVRRSLYFLDFAPFMFTSGLTGENFDAVLYAAKEIIQSYKKPFGPEELAETLQEIMVRRGPKKGVRIYSLTQNPLNLNTFLLKTNNPVGIDKTYLRFISNYMHEKFGLDGIPVKTKIQSARREDKQGSGLQTKGGTKSGRNFKRGK